MKLEKVRNKQTRKTQAYIAKAKYM